MSTEIKNTLFRFVTMRAPELLDPKDADDGFVKHPDLLHKENYFSLKLEAMSASVNKKQFLVETALEYKDVLKTVTEVKDLVSQDIYDFAMWLSKNRKKVTLEMPSQFKDIVPVNNLASILQLWDNLFYQVITSQSPYVRETIISILVADFFLQKRDNVLQTNKSMRKLAQARVIIPQEIFGIVKSDKASDIIQKRLSELPVSTKHLNAEVTTAVAQLRIKEYENIREELTLARRQYAQENKASYDSEKARYDINEQAAYDKASYIEKAYIDPKTGIERPYREYTGLKIPSFEFEPADELDIDQLAKSVSGETLEYIQNAIAMRGASSLPNVLAALEDTIQTEYNNAFGALGLNSGALGSNNGAGNPRSGGGTVTSGPRTNPVPTVPPVSGTPVFAITSVTVSTSGLTSLLVVMDGLPAGLDITSGDYKIIFNDNTTVVKIAEFTDSWVGGKLHLNLFTEKISIKDKTSFTLTGTFKTAGGDSVAYQGTGNITKTPNRSRLYNYDAKGNGSYVYTPFTIKDDEGNDVKEEEPVIVYKPSGFGIKRLGIADYRKVEQEVCCYVPGEVSHIENIMAREYKEKSTRRLSRSETTTTTSTEQEREKLTDTTTADRFEMNKEAASVVAEDTAIGAHASFSASWGAAGAAQYGLQAGADFAHNTSKENSDSQAITQAKDVTERALDRVVQKVKEERVIKIIEEFEENNKHGFDNRDSGEHVSGVYRWVDKVYRNRIINYGKRLMYEFMIPEPAAFHAQAVLNDGGPIPPVDPRANDALLKILKPSDINDENYMHWAGVYNAEVDPPLKAFKFSETYSVSDNNGEEGRFSSSGEKKIEIPEGYCVTSFNGYLTFYNAGNANAQLGIATLGNHQGKVSIGGLNFSFNSASQGLLSLSSSRSVLSIEKSIGVTISSWDLGSFAFDVVFTCEPTAAAKSKWQIDTFNVIIDAYEAQLKLYEQKIAELKAANENKSRINPLFYRQIENMSLRKSCIAYMVSHSSMGIDGLMSGRKTLNVIPGYDKPELETYTSLVKFFEQAFEWDLMSYNFYPFYWAHKALWSDLYNINNDDPLFRSFLQSGMARVILSVRPGFEEAVNWYMATGQVWNGGQVPTLDDPLFKSIVKELEDTEGVVEETWESRVPTSLTVIQAGSIGLDVEGLPCDPDCDEYIVRDENGNIINTLTNPIAQKSHLMGGPLPQPVNSEVNDPEPLGSN
jgi:hypothetical protein